MTGIEISDRDAEYLTIRVDGVPMRQRVRDWWESQCSASAPLDPYAVWTIRKRYIKEGVPAPALAENFGVSIRTIHRVVAGDTYKHIGFPE